MKVNELLSVTMAAEIFITTVENLTYYSTDGGNSFHGSIFNWSDEIDMKEINSHNVIKYAPRSEYRVEIYTD